MSKKINGHANHNGAHSNQVITPEMCMYCFEVLDRELNHQGSPGRPSFTNEALWVTLIYMHIISLQNIFLVALYLYHGKLGVIIDSEDVLERFLH